MPPVLGRPPRPFILLVNPGGESLEELRRALRKAGFTAVTVGNPSEALDYLRESGPVDLVAAPPGNSFPREVRDIRPGTRILQLPAGLHDVERLVEEARRALRPGQGKGP